MLFYDDAEVRSFLSGVERNIQEYLSVNPKFIYAPISQYLFRGGKRIRPILLFLSAKTSAPDIEITKEHRSISSIIEMFHNFTLIHDDIEDHSELRRGKDTLHISHGVPIAINMGDALYTMVWYKLATLDINKNILIKLLPLVTGSFQAVVNGQGTELEWYKTKRVDISEEEYFTMAGGKTASLMGLSCKLGALISGRDDLGDVMDSFGKNLGVGFQIRDDILNLTGSIEKYQKEIGGDISEGKRTLMTAYAFKHLNEKGKHRLRDILLMNTTDQSIINEAIELINTSGAIAYAKEKSDIFITKAKSDMENIEDSKYKELLLNVADFIVKRDV